MQMIYDEILLKYQDRKILDLGCGNCSLLNKLSRAGYKIKGIDANPFRVFKWQRNGNKCVYFALVEALPFDDESFDIIISQEVLEHILDIKQGIREMYRILRRGGIIFIQVPFRNLVDSEYHLRLFDTKTLQNLIAEKFEVLSCTTIPYLVGEQNNNIYLKAKKL